MIRSQESAIVLPEDSAKTTQADASAAAYQSLLWEITSAAQSHPSYLYGTIHIIPKDSFFLREGLEEKMAASERLIMEMPLDLNVGTALTSMMHMMMPRGESIQKYLSEEEYQQLTTFVKDSASAGLPIEMIRPFYTTQQIQLSYCMPGATESYEMVFSQEFKAAGKPIDGLETLKEQLKLVDDIPIEEQVTGLMSFVNQPQLSCEGLAEMIQLYRKQDLDGLMRLTTGEEEMSEEDLARFLDDRNARWISKIEAFIKEESVFIAVGAGHLAGPKGVIELLREAGYTVRPL
ncbi:MAG: TraB/GumN family protein [Bacteroidota bacterium]